MMMLIMTVRTMTLLRICKAPTFICAIIDANEAVFLRGNSSVCKIKRNADNRHLCAGDQTKKMTFFFLPGISVSLKNPK